MPDGKILFRLAPDANRTYYDLIVEYEYLNGESCGVPPWVYLGMPFDIIEGPVLELPPEYNIFPPLKVYHDCITNPACDPPLAYIGVKWGGGDLGMLFDYGSPAMSGDFQVSLLDRQGKFLATAKPIGPPMSSLASLAPEGLAVQGKKSLFAEGLKQDWYFLGVDG